MIDTHSHLLPVLDDGAQDDQETLEMVRAAQGDGINTIVATPHSFDGKFQNEPEAIKSLVANLNSALGRHGIGVRVLPGMEVRITPELFTLLDEGKVLTLNEGKYLLLEFHPSQIPSGFENLLQTLVDRGLGVVLAHPEKNPAIQTNPEYLYKLIRQFKPWHLLIQVTADSLERSNDLWAYRTAKMLFENNLVHLIATDAHSCGIRPPLLSQAVQEAAKIIGEETAFKMVTEIPSAVIGDGQFPPEWVPENPRRWWRLV